MKMLNKILGVGLLVFMLMMAAPLKSNAQDDYISEQDFYDELEPYGTWVYDSQYGDVWIPDVEADFKPYATRGYWALTEYGNTWVSDYPWGWATFHYGRWIYDDYYGWEWIPGNEWAPAWVSWRQGAGYYGWAPLSPGISIDVSFGGGYNVPDFYWAFAPQAYINSPTIYNYYVPQTRVVNIIRRSSVLRNSFARGGINYATGPRASDIERYSGRRAVVYGINEVRRPGAVTVRNNTVNIFRPSVRQRDNARPSRVVDADAYRRQNPGLTIARRNQNGAPGYNRDNAARLADVARNSNDNNVVRINRRNDNEERYNRSSQQRRPDQNDSRFDQRRPGGQGNEPVFTPNRQRGQASQNDALRQQAEQLKGQQQAVRQQRRQEWVREGQEQSVGRVEQPAPIYGQTPLQQQQMAVRDQKRQLERQQQQAERDQQLRFQKEQQQQANRAVRDQQQQMERGQRDQQLQGQRQQQQQADRAVHDQQQRQAQDAQRDQQRQQQQQAEQAQREQQRQGQQAAQQQQRQAQQQAEQAQREQQRQVQQAAQQQQRQTQQQAEQAQREQQRQAQQAAQQQQRQAQQQAEQAQREQQRQAQQAAQQQRQAQQQAQQQQQEAQRAQQQQQQPPQQQQQRGGRGRGGGR